MRILHLITLLPLLWSLSSCSSKWIPITQEIQNNRISITGASVLPPSGFDWHYKIINPARVHIGRQGEYDGQTIVALASAHKLPVVKGESDFLDKIREMSWKDKPSDNFKMLYQTESISSEKAAKCARMERSYQEFKSRYAPPSVQYLIIKDICLVCQHPESSKVGVSFCFSERSWPGRKFKKFEILANDFFQNAEFEKLTINDY